MVCVAAYFSDHSLELPCLSPSPESSVAEVVAAEAAGALLGDLLLRQAVLDAFKVLRALQRRTLAHAEHGAIRGSLPTASVGSFG